MTTRSKAIANRRERRLARASGFRRAPKNMGKKVGHGGNVSGQVHAMKQWVPDVSK